MAKPLITTKPVSAGSAQAALISITSGVAFALLLGSLHLLKPEFDPTWRYISEYELGGYGWLMRVAFFALAASLTTTALAIVSQVRTRAGYVGLALLGFAAVGMMMAAIFTTDPAITPADELTSHGKIHVFGASLDYTPIAALLLSLSLSRNQAWRPIRKQLFFTAFVTLVALTAFMVTLPYDGKMGPEVRAGLFGRFLIVSYLGWLIPVSFHAIRLHRQGTEVQQILSS